MVGQNAAFSVLCAYRESHCYILFDGTKPQDVLRDTTVLLLFLACVVCVHTNLTFCELYRTPGGGGMNCMLLWARQ